MRYRTGHDSIHHLCFRVGWVGCRVVFCQGGVVVVNVVVDVVGRGAGAGLGHGWNAAQGVAGFMAQRSLL